MNETLTKVAYTKTSPGTKKFFRIRNILIKSYSPDYEIMKTGLGERVIIYSIPSVPPKEEEDKKNFYFLLIQICKTVFVL